MCSMMNSTGSSASGSKGLSLPSSNNFASSQPLSATASSFESSARRSSPSTTAISTPRKCQGSRKTHRDKRRPLRDHQLDHDDDDMAENRAISNASSRRGQRSITHLLNYSAPLTPYGDQAYGSNGRYTRRQAGWGPGSGHHPVDKAKFVHANYRFVVSPNGDYRAQVSDADKHVDWASVQQVLASAQSQSTSCPICLCEPTAARMARCGHIFCLPCLIRFMHSASGDDESVHSHSQNHSQIYNYNAARKESRWRKCPICEDSFKLSDMRPVRFYSDQESPLPRPGDDVVLRLMVRDAGSTLTLPNEGGADPLNLGEYVPWHFAANVLDYARIMRGTNDYMMGQFDEEVDCLRSQAIQDEMQFGTDANDSTWMDRAIQAIQQAKDRVGAEDFPDLSTTSKSTTPTTVKSMSKGKQPALALSSSSSASAPNQSSFYFYSAPPHLYLSPLDNRILKAKFLDFSNFPATLLPRVEHVSSGHVVDDALRKRAKYLSHLPHGCVVTFLECDWTDIVSPEILEGFAPDLERRRKSHQDKAAQEERERVQAERLEANAIGRSARRQFDQVHPEETTSDAVVNDEDFLPLVSATVTTTRGSPPNPRIGFEKLADMSTSPSTSRTVWGTPAFLPGADEAEDFAPRPSHHSSMNGDGWLDDASVFEQAALAEQMELFHLDGSEGPSRAGERNQKKKKKGKQKITLMSTGGHRGG